MMKAVPPAPDQEVINRDFEVLLSHRREVEAGMTFEQRIAFITRVNAMDGHRLRVEEHITGDRFLM